MKKLLIYLMITILALLPLSACTTPKTPKIGVSFGVGLAERWAKEEKYMIDYAEANGAIIETRRNLGDTEKTQKQDCFELIDSGIDVLLIVPRDIGDMETINSILNYAYKNKVKVISYARMISGRYIDLFVGYDSIRIGEQIGTYLYQKTRGNYFVMRGPATDNNANLLNSGMMEEINRFTNDEQPEKLKIDIVASIEVPGWDPLQAETLFQAELDRLGGIVIDAVAAPNDKLAGAAVNVLLRNGYGTDTKKMPVITGMDAELDAIKRIVAGTQSMTVSMNFKTLAEKAMEIACRYAKKQAVTPNDSFDNASGEFIDAYMINGDTVIKSNIEKTLIDTGIYTREQIYGA